MFLHIPPSPPTITYNANSLNVRCRFSIAHELGHYVLKHRPISFSELFNGDLSRDARQEREACACCSFISSCVYAT
ncbi:ImmA/IrrE family metallo-endopeptidase [Acetomicrobium sp. S15 = DSM 107314]|uniref:ImmA/IrrE family metallo-endopeptidase n=1 Tax=Acetomicrobium sp. S15 = DSM 107314 TaxID=2529858 RepID=UPI0018E0DCF7